MRNLNTSEIKQVSGGLVISPFGFYFKVFGAIASASSKAEA